MRSSLLDLLNNKAFAEGARCTSKAAESTISLIQMQREDGINRPTGVPDGYTTLARHVSVGRYFIAAVESWESPACWLQDIRIRSQYYVSAALPNVISARRI
jgi:hypothetical protein